LQELARAGASVAPRVEAEAYRIVTEAIVGHLAQQAEQNLSNPTIQTQHGLST
jgi:hypothetical protein